MESISRDLRIYVTTKRRNVGKETDELALSLLVVPPSPLHRSVDVEVILAHHDRDDVPAHVVDSLLLVVGRHILVIEFDVGEQNHDFYCLEIVQRTLSMRRMSAMRYSISLMTG